MPLSGTMLMLLIFGVFAILALFLWGIPYFFRTTAVTRMERLAKEEELLFGSREEDQTVAEDVGEFLRKRVSPLARFSAPDGVDDEDSPLRRKLVTGGFYAASAVPVFLGAKTLLTFLFPAVLLAINGVLHLNLEGSTMTMVLLMCAGTGYFLPNMVLSAIVKRRNQEMYEIFPDVLDLLRICVESGLSMDVAITRVRDEIRIRSKAMAEEFRIISLEQRAGASRNMALNNFAKRLNLPDVDSLVSTLVQADRFGTSIAESLRIHSENLRLNRRLKAEELAAKIGTKILMPLIFCIFPLIFIVILAPAVSQVIHSMRGDAPASSESSEQ